MEKRKKTTNGVLVQLGSLKSLSLLIAWLVAVLGLRLVSLICLICLPSFIVGLKFPVFNVLALMWLRLGLIHSAFTLAGLNLLGVLDLPGVLT